MTTLPAHTPYDGSSKPFSIGLKQLDLNEWIEVGADFDQQLREKRRLYATIPEKVFVEEPDTRAAQAEVLSLLLDHLPRRFPDRYQHSCKGMAIKGFPGLPATELNAPPPLRAASLLVQEDLILMRRGDDGWRLAAGSLCFPSSWRLDEKFGRPLNEIHRPVPGFGPGTRMTELIERMFDRLQVPQPVERHNWSLQSDAELYHPLSDRERIARAANRPSTLPDIAAGFIRVERQTLRKLPVCGDILFTIRIHLDPLAVLEKHPDGPRLAASFAEQLAGMDAAQLDYKGLAADRDRLVSHLKSFAGLA